MKRVLITGANSFIGTSVENYLARFAGAYQVETLDMVGDAWREKDFSGYDTIFHVAGIAHQDSGKLTEERKQLYYRVNTDLTVETAKKAKAEGAGQFIFMSSMIVYGASGRMGQKKMITRETPPSPEGAYGDSKLQADLGILPLNSAEFKVCILRPPMIYGEGSKGNYPILEKAALKLPFFPDVENERSMLQIDGLCAYVKWMIDTRGEGIHFPQNKEAVNTSELVRKIAESHGKTIRLTKVFNPLLKLLSGRIKVVDKVFGNLLYAKDTYLQTPEDHA